ncbi:MAG TPA: glucan biosynthesis protein G [Rhodanobacteraceae bacterium]|nr:glucan biosynthesis protein G [Rhodanobacteraceae bacterium]
MPTRSNTALLAFALIAGGGLRLAEAAPPAFGFDDVDARARALADAAFQDAGTNLPGALQHLDHERYAGIRFRPEAARWRKAKLPFELEMFHEGWLFDRPVKLDEIGTKGVSDIAFDATQFDYAASGIDPAAANGLGYAGFAAHYALNLPAYKDEVLAFLGASYFRALGKGQTYGLSARGLAIDTAVASGEEFPRFVEFWFERPQARADTLVFYGLLDSPRATGAYRFAFTPGVESIVEVTARVYLRDKVGKLGVAPLTSMYFHGANQHAAGEDYRPEVHDSDGLSIQSKSGEWIWRPLVNPKRLLVTSFALESPGGFGLMQRQRTFAAYQDLSTRYEAHPSAWVEPIGAWGPGRIELVQIPAPDETNDNIVAYWIADRVPQPKQPIDLHYRVHWQKDGETAPPTARVVETRRGKGYMPKPDNSIGFVVDYAGPMLAGLGDDAPVAADVSTDANGAIVDKLVRRNPETGGYRLELHVRRVDDNKPVEIRAALRNGDKVSETWSYALPPG